MIVNAILPSGESPGRAGVACGMIRSMNARRQYRHVPVSNFRAVSGGPVGRIAATVLRYDVIDEYGTEFAPETFLESLAHRMPRIVWAHDWSDPIGRWLGFENVRDDLGIRLDLTGQLDMGMRSDGAPAVPRAHQAFEQLDSGTIDQFSVGFRISDADVVMRDGQEILRFTRGDLDEASLVIVGAVPGTELLSVRSPLRVIREGGVVPREFAAEVLVDLHSGTLDLADALQRLKHHTDQPMADGAGEGEEPQPEPTPTEPPPATEPEPEQQPDTSQPTAPTVPATPGTIEIPEEADEKVEHTKVEWDDTAALDALSLVAAASTSLW